MDPIKRRQLLQQYLMAPQGEIDPQTSQDLLSQVESGQAQQIQDLEQQRQLTEDKQALAGYGSAADKIISSIAGTKAQPEVYKNMQSLAAAPVQDAGSRSKIIRDALRQKYNIAALTGKEKQAEQAGKLEAFKTATAPTEGQKALDKAYAKDYNEWVTQGGYANAKASIDSVRSGLKKLADTDFATGPMVSMAPDALRKRIPGLATGAKAQQNIEAAVMSSLRATLGAQFTEREGKKVLALTFDPAFEEGENVARATRLINKLEEIAKQKDAAAKHFEKHGSVVGFTAPTSAAALVGSTGETGRAPGGENKSEMGIKRVMDKNKVDRKTAIDALIKAKKLPGGYQ